LKKLPIHLFLPLIPSMTYVGGCPPDFLLTGLPAKAGSLCKSKDLTPFFPFFLFCHNGLPSFAHSCYLFSSTDISTPAHLTA